MSFNKEVFFHHLAQTSPKPLGIEITHADGIYLYDQDGKDYIDVISGVSVSNIGHNNAEIKEAVKKQLDNYTHLMVYGELIQGPQIKYAEALCKQLPELLQQVYFVNSGSEAIEGAMKLAKRFTQRTEIISFKKSYHGSTQGALSILGDESYRNAFRPLLPDIRQLDYNSEESLNQISTQTACVVVELIQSEAGVVLPDQSFLTALAQHCKKKNVLLIADECQTGFYRTGKCFAFEHFKIIPDIIVLAKALGGGFPLGAFISSPEVMSTLSHNPVLGHITTFGGHPVSCSAGLAAFQYLQQHLSEDDIAIKSDIFYNQLIQHKKVLEIRRMGLLMAVELGSSNALIRFIENAIRHGILTDWFLFCDTAFRISPPLIITHDEIMEACKRVIIALDEI